MRLPTYRRHSSRDKAFVEVDGRRHYLPGKYGSIESREAYRRFLHDNVLTDNPPLADRHTIDLADALELYASHAIGRFGTDSKETRHIVLLCDRLIDHCGPMALDCFTPRVLKQFRDDMAASGKSRAYCNDTVKRARRIFKWLTSEELYPGHLFVGLQSISGLRRGESAAREPQRRQPVDYYAIYPVLWCLSRVVRTMVLLQWYTGARSANVCRLRPREIDTTTNPWAWTPSRHKTDYRGHGLTIYIGPQCQRAIDWVLDRDRDRYAFDPREVRSGWRGVRDHYDPGSYRQAILRAQGQAGSTIRWTPHQLRHGRATMIRARYDLEAAQAALGHESLGATQIYAQKKHELARKVASEIG